jgi:hypothetical protein
MEINDEVIMELKDLWSNCLEMGIEKDSLTNQLYPSLSILGYRIDDLPASEYISLEEIADIACVTKSCVSNWVYKKGGMPVRYKQTQANFFDRDEVMKWLKENGKI